ncbi:GDYXXLXY domain-containing protein [Prosthecobacter sp.]|uniref:GDYXXLXY domain-containing protein n=1 Tax=Prosthecobacter sp. TaxID=1965333 RepID=UPI001DB4BCDF|nr:GDYXXLXY domain-containing protein [Prosthecobacter sp.]MCB1277678.1 GDYXXLXY domain-containing protein [Prosthecobacter sp.]
MKSLPILVFALAALAQWAAPLSQIWTHEQVLAKGTLVRLKCRAPDPYDPLRGRFLAVWPEQTDAPVPDGAKIDRGSQVFFTLTPGADGLSTITSISTTPPGTGIWLRARAGYVYDKKVNIEWPFERFYINEKLAPEADKWFAQNIRGDQGIVAEVRVLNGRAVLADLSLDGKSFREILKERVK